MIAPLRQPRESSSRRSPSFLRARRAVAAALLGQTQSPPSAPLIAPGRAWLMAAWMVGVFVVYVVTLVWSRLG
jgi:hypothetical protein